MDNKTNSSKFIWKHIQAYFMFGNQNFSNFLQKKTFFAICYIILSHTQIFRLIYQNGQPDEDLGIFHTYFYNNLTSLISLEDYWTPRESLVARCIASYIWVLNILFIASHTIYIKKNKLPRTKITPTKIANYLLLLLMTLNCYLLPFQLIIPQTAHFYSNYTNSNPAAVLPLLGLLGLFIQFLLVIIFTKNFMGEEEKVYHYEVRF